MSVISKHIISLTLSIISLIIEFSIDSTGRFAAAIIFNLSLNIISFLIYLTPIGNKKYFSNLRVIGQIIVFFNSIFHYIICNMNLLNNNSNIDIFILIIYYSGIIIDDNRYFKRKK